MQFQYIKLLFSTTLIIIITSSLPAQSSFDLSGGAHFVNRYIWRGLEINGTPNIQPTVEAIYGGLTAGLWGSYAIAESSTSDEIDLYLSYTFSTTSAGDFSFLFTDYYFPVGSRISDFSDSSSHYLEASFNYSGPSAIPISLYLGYTFKPKLTQALYWEVSYASTVTSFGFNIFVGGTDGGKDDAAYYGTSAFAVINTGFIVSKVIELNETFSMPLSVSFILNPNQEKVYLIFGVGLSM